MEEATNFVSNYEDVSQFSKAALQATVNAVKRCTKAVSTSNSITDSSISVKEMINRQGKQLLELMSEIMKHQSIKRNLNSMDLDDKVDLLAEVNDLFLEKIGLSLDDASGKKKLAPVLTLATENTKSFIRTSWNRKIATESTSSKCSLLTAKNIVRPQLKFTEKIDNSNKPFEPIIKEKPNSIRPLAIVLEPTKKGLMFSHPYECELEHFKPLAEQINKVTPQSPKPLDETPLIYIDKPEQLTSLMTELRDQKEIAIDLEHHSYRSFQGITCLMQLSTRSKDYIIDTLELRSHLQILNEVFTDPKIVKVLHGADMDIVWLQRDFGLYIINMFDTGQACRILNLMSYSLAFLLKLYCKISADKKHQLSDWRIRPLPDEMVKYAREDTHYLLYIYDMLKNELITTGNEQKNLLMSVLHRSKLLCLERYEKPIYNDEAHLGLYEKSKKLFNSRQMHILKELCKWRDVTARINDESTSYVLPTHMLLQISEEMPREQEGIVACCTPTPPLVRQYLNELHMIIVAAMSLPLAKVESQQLQINLAQTRQKIDLNNPLLCPHDFSYLVRDNVDSNVSNVNTVLKRLLKTVEVVLKPQIMMKIQSNTEKEMREKYIAVTNLLKNNATPYQRYLAIKAAEPTEMASEETKVTNDAMETTTTTSNKQTVSGETDDDDELDEQLPLRNLLPQKTKKRKTTGLGPPKKKIKEEEFQPFDYSKEKLKTTESNKKKLKKRPKHFDTDDFQIQYKTGKKSRKNQAHNCKSITFTK